MTVDRNTFEAYRQDGVVLLRQAFGNKWIEKLRAGLAANMESPGKYRRDYGKNGEHGVFFGDYCNWQRIRNYKEFICHSPASEIARNLMGSEKVNFFHEHVIVKSPGTKELTPWHHDHPYYCINGMDTCSLWVPLDPVPRETAVEFIAGSHLWGRLFRPKMFVGDDYPESEDLFEDMPDIDAERQSYRIVAFDLQPGDCVAFHFRTVHGAPGNSSTTSWRRAIAFRWTGDDITFCLRNGIMSPPFHEFDECHLKPGDPLDSDLFPLINPFNAA